MQSIENETLKHPQRKLISRFKLENGTERFVQYSPRKCFNNFVQSVVNARREGIKTLFRDL